MATTFNASDTINNPMTYRYGHTDEVGKVVSSINYDVILEIEAKKDYYSCGTGLSSESITSNKNVFTIPKGLMYKKDNNYETYFTKTQKWIGHVTKVGDGTFLAKLQDLTSKGTYEIGEFDIEEVSEGDKELLKIGSAFYWSIGYSYQNTQVSKKSIIRFQRIVEFTNADLDDVLDRATDLANNLNWD